MVPLAEQAPSGTGAARTRADVEDDEMTSRDHVARKRTVGSPKRHSWLALWILCAGALSLVVARPGRADLPPSTSGSSAPLGTISTPAPEAISKERPSDGQPLVDRVQELRKEVATSQSAYGDRITEEIGRLGADVYVHELRELLSEYTAGLVVDAGAVDVKLAIYRAQTETLLTVIHEYEEHFGAEGEPTTEWNVLATDDVRSLRDKAARHWTVLEAEKAKLPTHELPPELSHHILETKQWISGLEQTLRDRAQGEPRLKRIRDDVSVAEARKEHDSIREADILRDRFKEKLRLHTALRQAWSPKNAALKAFEERLAKSAATSVTSPEVKVDTNKGARPPPPPDPNPVSLTPSLPKGPRPNDKGGAEGPRGPPIDLSASEFSRAPLAETIALIARDPVLAARARARANVYAAWIQLERPGSTPAAARLAGLTSAELVTMRQDHAAWYAKLTEEEVQKPDSLDLRAEKADCHAWIDALDLELRERHLPTTDIWRSDPRQAVIDETRQRAFIASARALLAAETHTELQLVAVRPRSVPDAKLRSALEEATVLGVEASAAAIEEALATIETERRRAIGELRGAERAERVRALIEARAGLRAAASELSRSAAAPRLEEGNLRTRLQARAKDLAVIGRDGPEKGKGILASLAQANELTARVAPPTVRRVVLEVRPSSLSEEAVRFELHANPGAHLRSTVEGEFRLPVGYEALFPKGEEWTRSYKGTTFDFHRAPGGILIDAALPARVAMRINSAQADPVTGAVRVLLGRRWLAVEPKIDITEARAAWALVLDGRVSIIDQRDVVDEDRHWFIRTYAKPSLDAEGIALLDAGLPELSAVSLHPGVDGSALATSLIAADSMILDLVESSGETTGAQGAIDLAGLRSALAFDEAVNGGVLQSLDSPYLHSLLSVTKVIPTQTASTLRVEASFSFDLCAVSSGNSGISLPPFCFEEGARWFHENQGLLRKRLGSLDRAARFAALVAVFRSVMEMGAPNNFDQLFLTETDDDDAPSPAFFCDAAGQDRCDPEVIRRWLNVVDPRSPNIGAPAHGQ